MSWNVLDYKRNEEFIDFTMVYISFSAINFLGWRSVPILMYEAYVKR